MTSFLLNFWLYVLQSKVRWRFRKILRPSQNIWTLNVDSPLKQSSTYFDVIFNETRAIFKFVWPFQNVQTFNWKYLKVSEPQNEFIVSIRVKKFQKFKSLLPKAWVIIVVFFWAEADFWVLGFALFKFSYL
jgi:hypothetical protein